MATAIIRMTDGVTQRDVTVSDTNPMITRAVDASAAINTAYSFSDGRMKVIWGFQIVAGFNDRIEFAANLNGTATNVNATIAAGNYLTGASLATAITTAMQTAEDAFAGGKRVNITVTYTGGNKFNWAWTEVRATVSQFILRGAPSAGAGGYAATALDVVGIQKGGDAVGNGSSGNMDGDSTVIVRRFKFGYSGLAAGLLLADAAFTAESFFGITDTTTKTFGAYLCGSDMVTTLTITASAGSGGTIDPTGAVSVEYGQNQSFTIAPAAGYLSNSLLVDSSEVGGGQSSYTFTAVIVTHTIAASFVAQVAGVAGPTASPVIRSGSGARAAFIAIPKAFANDAEALWWANACQPGLSFGEAQRRLQKTADDRDAGRGL